MKLFDRLKADAAAEWQSYVAHPFVDGLGSGALPDGSFRHYLAQDYLFLIHFARAYALAIYKAQTLDEMRSANETLKAILDVEMQLHVRLCARWGLSPEDLEALPEASATVAYTRFVLEAGMRGDLLDLHVALSPCVIGYSEIGCALAERPGALEDGNPYAEWIAEYSSDEYSEVSEAAGARLDSLAATYLTDARYPRLLELFRQATRLEADFWDMGLNLSD